jgi:hypothetical protein
MHAEVGAVHMCHHFHLSTLAKDPIPTKNPQHFLFYCPLHPSHQQRTANFFFPKQLADFYLTQEYERDLYLECFSSRLSHYEKVEFLLGCPVVKIDKQIPRQHRNRSLLHMQRHSMLPKNFSSKNTVPKLPTITQNYSSKTPATT